MAGIDLYLQSLRDYTGHEASLFPPTREQSVAD